MMMVDYSQVYNDFIQLIYKEGKDTRHQSWNCRADELQEDAGNIPFSLLQPKRFLSEILESKECDVIQAIDDLENAFYCFIPYALNLWREPNREEYKFLKTYTGYFTANIASVMKGSERHVLELLGYQVKPKCQNEDEFILKNPQPPNNHIGQLAFELYLLQPYYRKIKMLCEEAVMSKHPSEMIVQLLLERDLVDIFKHGLNWLCVEKMSKKNSVLSGVNQNIRSETNNRTKQPRPRSYFRNENEQIPSSPDPESKNVTGNDVKERLVMDADEVNEDELYQVIPTNSTVPPNNQEIIRDVSNIQLPGSKRPMSPRVNRKSFNPPAGAHTPAVTKSTDEPQRVIPSHTQSGLVGISPTDTKFRPRTQLRNVSPRGDAHIQVRPVIPRGDAHIQVRPVTSRGDAHIQVRAIPERRYDISQKQQENVGVVATENVYEEIGTPTRQTGSYQGHPQQDAKTGIKEDPMKEETKKGNNRNSDVQDAPGINKTSTDPNDRVNRQIAQNDISHVNSQQTRNVASPITENVYDQPEDVQGDNLKNSPQDTEEHIYEDFAQYQEQIKCMEKTRGASLQRKGSGKRQPTQENNRQTESQGLLTTNMSSNDTNHRTNPKIDQKNVQQVNRQQSQTGLSRGLPKLYVTEGNEQDDHRQDAHRVKEEPTYVELDLHQEQNKNVETRGTTFQRKGSGRRNSKQQNNRQPESPDNTGTCMSSHNTNEGTNQIDQNRVNLQQLQMDVSRVMPKPYVTDGNGQDNSRENTHGVEEEHTYVELDQHQEHNRNAETRGTSLQRKGSGRRKQKQENNRQPESPDMTGTNMSSHNTNQGTNQIDQKRVNLQQSKPRLSRGLPNPYITDGNELDVSRQTAHRVEEEHTYVELDEHQEHNRNTEARYTTFQRKGSGRRNSKQENNRQQESQDIPGTNVSSNDTDQGTNQIDQNRVNMQQSQPDVSPVLPKSYARNGDEPEGRPELLTLFQFGERSESKQEDNRESKSQGVPELNSRKQDEQNDVSEVSQQQDQKNVCPRIAQTASEKEQDDLSRDYQKSYIHGTQRREEWLLKDKMKDKLKDRQMFFTGDNKPQDGSTYTNAQNLECGSDSQLGTSV